MKFELPNDPKIAEKVIAAESQHAGKVVERGLIGMLFGSAQEKPGNIAGFVLIISFITLACILIWGNDTASITKKDMALVLAGFITTTLGFVFGRTTS